MEMKDVQPYNGGASKEHVEQKLVRNLLRTFESKPIPLHFSETFAINYGIVTIDPKKMWFLLTSTSDNTQYAFPEGRKKVDEDLGTTAVRETSAKIGVQCKLKSYALKTLPTCAPTETNEEEQLTREPLAVTQRNNDGCLEITFWYLAEADSTNLKPEGCVWARESEVVDALESLDQGEIAEKCMQLFTSK